MITPPLDGNSAAASQPLAALNYRLIGVDFDRLARVGNEARDRIYVNAKVKNTRI
jgi:hypothetical protein